MPRLRPRAVLTARDLPVHRAAIAGPADGISMADPPEAAAAPTAADPGSNNFVGRLATYIPAEVIAAYHTVEGFIARGEQGENAGGAVPPPLTAAENNTLLVVGLVLLALTPVWIYVSTKNGSEPPAWHQVINATIAFAVWLLVTGNPIATRIFGQWDPIYGSAAMVVTVIIIFPIIEALTKRRS
ncbi:MAG TPA: hypothetical protein VN231_11555 [Allosphingosinicella sp.]|nr:hypothetical protein [Allosphingosinicella sp.]